MSGLRETKKRETRFAIMNTALELFRSDGYENTSIQSICSACGIAKGTFYNYFGSKEDIVRMSFRNGFDKYISFRMQKLDIQAAPKESLEKYLIYSLDYMKKIGQETSSLALICNIKSAVNRGEDILYVDMPHDERFVILRDIYQAGLNASSWRAGISEGEFIHYVSVFISGLLTSFCFSVDSQDIVEQSKSIVSHFIETL